MPSAPITPVIVCAFGADVEASPVIISQGVVESGEPLDLIQFARKPSSWDRR